MSIDDGVLCCDLKGLSTGEICCISIIINTSEKLRLVYVRKTCPLLSELPLETAGL